MNLIIGIDPGVAGAIALVRGTGIVMHDMPTVEVRGKRLVDVHGLARIISGLGASGLTGSHAVLEHVQGVQQSGATSAFSFGRSFGVVEGVLAGLGVPMTLVRPQAWTRDLAVSRDKGEHRRAAMRLWPAHAELFSRVKDDGRADAALLCYWWSRARAA